MDIKIAVAIVTNRQVRPKTVLSLMKMIADTPFSMYPIVSEEHYTTAEGRAYCVWQARKNDCSHILFVDDDMVFPNDTLEKLMSHRKEIVGVFSYSRVLPLSPTVMFMDENRQYLPQDKMTEEQLQRPKELFECWAVGMGVALIDMDVFNKIVEPWFNVKTHDNGKVLLGEDAFFCARAHEVGIGVWCDPTLEIMHLGEYAYGEKII